MERSEKDKKSVTINVNGPGGISVTPEKDKSWLPVLAIVFAILAAFAGSYSAVYFQNQSKTDTTSKLVYDDIDRMGWTLNNLNLMIIENPNATPVIITAIYSDNGVYYSSRPEIALLNQNVARNISIFYTDLQYAENYRQAIVIAVEPNAPNYAPAQIAVSKEQYKTAISEANSLRPQILQDLERIYHIPKSPPNRFNQY